MTVGLVMIVKNEQHTLPRLAQSLQGHIDYWTIVDTGSTDETIRVAHQVFDYVPGQLISADWQGYGAARNVALQAAEDHTDWLLHMDADETFHGQLPAMINTDEHLVQVKAEERHGATRFYRTRLVRSGHDAHWEGRAHEYLVLAYKPEDQGLDTTSFYIEHHGDGGNRSDKFQREIELLNQDWDESQQPRTAFYLARSYDDMGDYAQAVLWYMTRIAQGGWHEEVFYSRYRLGMCLLQLGEYDQACGSLWHAWGVATNRAEPLVALAGYYREHALWRLAWQAVELAFSYCSAQPGNFWPEVSGNLFYDWSAVEWRAAHEGSIIAWYVDQSQRGRMLCDYLLERGDLPPEIRANVEHNYEFYKAS